MMFIETLRVTICSLVAPLLIVATSYDDAEEIAQLKESRAKWEQVRKECGGDYRYIVVHSSFTGRTETTTVVVEDNRVVERKLEVIDRIPMPTEEGKLELKPKLAWIEKGSQVGSHRDHNPQPRTLDELYDIAMKMLEKSSAPEMKRSIAFDNQGILSHCFEVDSRIADDAPLKGIAPLKLTIPTPDLK